jgi:hypothetical protein
VPWSGSLPPFPAAGASVRRPTVGRAWGATSIAERAHDARGDSNDILDPLVEGHDLPELLFGGEPVRRLVDGSTGLDAVVWQRLDLGFALARTVGSIPTAPVAALAPVSTGRWTAMTFARGSSGPSAGPLRERPADRLRQVMRLLAALGVLMVPLVCFLRR